MVGDFIKINEWLTPLSWMYGLGVNARNQLFELGILKSRSFKTPVISVGNITVGGAGKTPHVEYLIELLRSSCKVAVLSRGYKRKTRGFLLADEHTQVRDIGDEPFQMKTKFPDIQVAVDANRCHGIDMLTNNNGEESNVPTPDVILLDDAFQHRYVKPGVNILLVDYHRLIIYDKLLPAGRLREPQEGKGRADIVIITKCPAELKPIDYRVIKNAMGLFPYQALFFTTIDYGNLQPLFGNGEKEKESMKDQNVLLLTGIASPKLMEEDLTAMGARITPLSYPDHHRFSKKDFRRINEAFDAMPSPKMIVTTEKDAVRLQHAEGLSDEVRQHIYQLPIRVKFMLEQAEEFNKKITGYVRKNSRNSILVKGKDDHKSKNSHRPGNRPRTISFRNN
jgi:tetraacyldisaccharide 4'-kinase